MPAALVVMALPLGFVEEGIAVAAGFFGLYFMLPAVVAWGLDRVRGRLPRWAQRTFGAVILLVTLVLLPFWFVFLGPFLLVGAVPAAVVIVVGWRLLRAA